MEYMSDSLSDEQLAALVQKGDEAAFAALMQRYTDKLLRYGRRILPRENNVGDIVQDVFVTVYQNIQDFDVTRPFSPWIYRITHNALVNVIRKKVKEPLFLFDFDRIMPHAVYEDPIVTEKEKEEMRVILEKSLEEIPSAYREIIGLYYFEDFSYKEIADILHIPVGTVGIRLSRAKAALKKKFPKNEYE